MGIEYWRSSCFLVNTEKHSSEEYCLGGAVAVECKLLPSEEKSKDTMLDLVLETIVSACIKEAEKLLQGRQAWRPTTVMFESEKMWLQLEQTLRKMGINDTRVAGKDLLASAASIEDIAHSAKKKALNLLLNMDPVNPQPLKDLVTTAVASDRQSENVSEARASMRKWKPPRDCKIPLECSPASTP